MKTHTPKKTNKNFRTFILGFYTFVFNQIHADRYFKIEPLQVKSAFAKFWIRWYYEPV